MTTVLGAAGGSSALDEGRHRQLLEGMLCAVPLRLALLDMELRFVWVGPGLGRALGFETEGCLGRSIGEVAPALANWLEPLIGNLLATAPAGGACDFALGDCSIEESDRAGRGELRLVTDAEGGVIGVVIVVSSAALPDATALVASRERAWCVFLERFAHDLRNPLTPILAAAQMLRRYGADKPEIVEWAAVAIERQARQLNARLEDVLALARAKQGTLVVAADDVDLGPILEQLVAEFRPLAQEGGLILDAEFPCRGLPVRGEKTRLELILRVLLTRAIETTSSGGSLEIHAVRAADQILVRVSDTGVGFETTMSEAIFDPLDCEDPTSSPRRSHNDRVGLALARVLATRLGGSLMAFSAGTDRGAEFVLQLPIGDVTLSGQCRQDGPPGDLLL